MEQNYNFKIKGSQRRKLKKELSELKHFIKYFWYHHNLDEDMCSFYDRSEKHKICDEKAKVIFENTNIQIKKIEEELNTQYQS